MKNFNKFCPFPWFFLNWNEVLEHWLASEERYTGHLLALQGSNLWTDTAAGEIWNIYFSLMLLSQWNVGSLNWMIFISVMISFQHQQLWINWHSLSRRPIHAFPLKISLKYFIFPVTHKQCVYRLMCVLSFTEKKSYQVASGIYCLWIGRFYQYLRPKKFNCHINFAITSQMTYLIFF